MEHMPTIHHSGAADLHALLQGRKTRWYQGHLAKLNLIIFLLIITSANNGYDGSMMNNLQTLPQWADYFHHPKGGTLGIFNAIQSIGGIVGLPFAPYVSDRFGRRWTMFLGAGLMLIGVTLQTAAQNVGMFIGCRFVIGFGLAFSCLAAPVLITELAYPLHRAPLTSLYNSSWYLGSIVAAWSTFGTFRINSTWAWRIPSLLQGVPSLIQFCLILFIPESPRWLIDHGKEEQALAIIAKHHCDGDMDDPLVAFEYQEIKEALRLEKEANASSTYWSLFTTAGNRRRMAVIIPIAFFSQWSGNGIVSYYLNLALAGVGVTSTSQQLIYNGVLQVWNLITAYFGALMVDKAGRRRLFLITTAGMTVTLMAWTICAGRYNITHAPAAGHAVLGLIFIYYTLYNLSLSPLLVAYTVEILPFRLRTKGLMVMQESVNASLVFNQYVNPIALDKLAWKYYIVYTVWVAFEFVYLYFTVIETKGKDGPLSLEEIAALFDGEDAVANLGASTQAQLSGPAGPPSPSAEADEKSGHVAQLEKI